MANTPKKCYIVDKVTGRIVSEHPTIQDAAAKLGLNVSVSRQIRNKRLLVNSRYTIRLVDDYDPHESFAGKRHGVPVVVSHGRDVRVFVDRKEIAKELYLTIGTVNMHIARGSVTSNGYRFRKMTHMGELNAILGSDSGALGAR